MPYQVLDAGDMGMDSAVMPSWGLQMRLVQGQNAKIPFLSIIRATPVARGRVMREHCPSVTREPSEVEIQRHEGGCLLQL